LKYERIDFREGDSAWSLVPRSKGRGGSKKTKKKRNRAERELLEKKRRKGGRWKSGWTVTIKEGTKRERINPPKKPGGSNLNPAKRIILGQQSRNKKTLHFPAKVKEGGRRTAEPQVGGGQS